jgi:hypothetical protein
MPSISVGTVSYNLTFGGTSYGVTVSSGPTYNVTLGAGVGGGGASAINDLTDVTITTPADNELLAYDTGSGEFINQTPAEAGLADAAHTHTLSDVTDSGTAAALDVPAAGDAAVGEVVKGDDTRLTDARTPSSHASSHITGGGDEIDGDKLDVDWNPTNYTPATTPTEADSVDNLTAHLYGIDQALANLGGDISVGSFYDNAGQTITTTETTVNLTTTKLNVGAIFTLATNVVTIGESGNYLFLYRVGGQLAAGTRSGFVCRLELDTGGGYVDVVGSDASAYLRVTTEDMGTAHGSIAFACTAGDKVRLRAQGTTESIDTTAGFSGLTVVKLEALGAQGPVGPAGPTGDITWQGPWSAGTYTQNQAVENGGSSYVCTAVSTTAEPPHADWDLMAAASLGMTTRTLTIQSPGAGEDITVFFTDRAITITEIRAVRTGGTDIDWTLYHDTAAHGTTNTIVARTSTAATPGDDLISFSDPTIPADSFITYVQGTTDGSPTEISITIIYTED